MERWMIRKLHGGVGEIGIEVWCEWRKMPGVHRLSEEIFHNAIRPSGYFPTVQTNILNSSEFGGDRVDASPLGGEGKPPKDNLPIVVRPGLVASISEGSWRFLPGPPGNAGQLVPIHRYPSRQSRAKTRVPSQREACGTGAGDVLWRPHIDHLE